MANEAIEVLIGLRVRHREGGPRGRGKRTRWGGRARGLSTRDITSAVCRRALKPHGVRAIVERLWAGYGGCQPRSVRICTHLCVRRGPRRSAASRATVLEVLARAACWQTVTLCRSHLPPRTKEDAARLRKSFQGPAPGAACPIFSLRVRHRSRGGPVWGLFHAVVPAPLRPMGDIAEVARANASSVFSPVQI